ncbi:hypothetical protein [uncultured Methylobacterium sp.]|uniref:hypothetical protein n=1 Tax=uncultured Methylobacterium sp. TaxID=157278 RepID=UPI0035CB6E6C
MSQRAETGRVHPRREPRPSRPRDDGTGLGRERRVALVTGVSASCTLPAPNAVGDAEAVGGMLRAARLASVVTLRDPTLRDLKCALVDLSAIALRTPKGSVPCLIGFGRCARGFSKRGGCRFA